MKQWEHKLIQLKYEGRTYKDMAKLISKYYKIMLTDGTVKNLFAASGRLFIPYLDYEAKQNNWNEEHSRQQYKVLATKTAEMTKAILSQVMKEKNWGLAYKMIMDINDRAGLVVIKKSEVNVDDTNTSRIDNYEQLLQALEREGIDPRTGFRTPKATLEQN